jgi:hypothetical protein
MQKKCQLGEGVYEGHEVASYKIFVCDTCYSSNWDGWAPYYEEFILTHLKEKGLPIPDRNEKGWLPRD